MAVFYVDPDGSDSDNGSSGAPWATLKHASENCGTDCFVNVAAGTYDMDDDYILPPARTYWRANGTVIIQSACQLATGMILAENDGVTWDGFRVQPTATSTQFAVSFGCRSGTSTPGPSANSWARYINCRCDTGNTDCLLHQPANGGITLIADKLYLKSRWDAFGVWLRTGTIILTNSEIISTGDSPAFDGGVSYGQALSFASVASGLSIVQMSNVVTRASVTSPLDGSEAYGLNIQRISGSVQAYAVDCSFLAHNPSGDVNLDIAIESNCTLYAANCNYDTTRTSGAGTIYRLPDGPARDSLIINAQNGNIGI